MGASDRSDADRALFVMAHPDDTEILAGGAVLHLRDRGWQIGIVTMTAGDCGSLEHEKEEITRIRHEEARSAAESVDAWYACAGLRDMEIFAGRDAVRRTVELMRRFDPDLVVTHSPADYLTDHEETSRIVRSGAFAAAMPLYRTEQTPPAEPASGTPPLYYADPVEGVDALGERIEPQFYVEIGDRIDQKAELLAHHESQREWLRAYHAMDRYIEEMKKYGRRYGSECGAEYAEGYRQHLGHGYPRDPLLQEALGDLVVSGSPSDSPSWIT